jgi:hypothetical protein
MAFCVTLFDTIENPTINDACFASTTQNLTINQGSSYKIRYLLTKNSQNVNLLGYSARGEIKPSITSPTVLLDMNSGNLLLNTDIDNSELVMILPESFTRQLTSSLVVYYIELISPLAEVSKIVSGAITVVPQAA